jgi:hypothetical protein
MLGSRPNGAEVEEVSIDAESRLVSPARRLFCAGHEQVRAEGEQLAESRRIVCNILYPYLKNTTQAQTQNQTYESHGVGNHIIPSIKSIFQPSLAMCCMHVIYFTARRVSCLVVLSI